MTEYKLVPVEPTTEMIKNGVPEKSRYGEAYAEACYRAMIAAAPSPAWVKTSDRLPTREDADDDCAVWAWPIHDIDNGFIVEVVPYDWVEGGVDYAKKITHWMPKPRVQPPEPPNPSG